MKLTKRIEDILATMETVFEEELTEEAHDHVAALMDELRQTVRQPGPLWCEYGALSED